jgi:hypothetical protein
MNTNPFQITFTLRQHTPIIHFQHTQAGATLRATEVKPKLDRFIKKNVADSVTEIMKIASDKEALDYKIKILPVNADGWKIEERTNYGSFFGAMGDGYKKNPKYANITNEEIIGQITCFNSELYKLLEANLTNFFALHNFGTRQSKGFGSYTCTAINGKPQKFPSKHFKYSFSLSYKKDFTDFKAQKELSENIDIFYRSLRSGINLQGAGGSSFYFKSALFMYLSSKAIQWDKKTIKANYFNKADKTVSETKKKNGQLETKSVDLRYLNGQGLSHSINNVVPDILLEPRSQDQNFSLKLYRDRLGLSNMEKWYSYREIVKKTEAKQQGVGWLRKAEKEEQITRYKSPIFFKVQIDTKNKQALIHFDVFENHETVLAYQDTMFNVHTKPENVQPPLHAQENLFMPIANASEFDLSEFLSYAFNNIDPVHHMVKKGNQNEQMNAASFAIVHIYKQLKKK